MALAAAVMSYEGLSIFREHIMILGNVGNLALSVLIDRERLHGYTTFI